VHEAALVELDVLDRRVGTQARKLRFGRLTWIELEHLQARAQGAAAAQRNAAARRERGHFVRRRLRSLVALRGLTA